MSKDQEKTLVKIFNDFVSNHNPNDYDKFDSKYIFSHPLWTWNTKISLRNLLISVGINPDCVLSTKKGLYKNTENFFVYNTRRTRE